MDRLSARGLLGLAGFVLGFGLLGGATWTMRGFSAGPARGDGFGAGAAFLATLLLGVVGVGVVGLSLVVSPSSRDAGAAVLTVGRRQRHLAGAGVTILWASVIVPVAVYVAVTAAAALQAWIWTTATGVVVVSVSFLWTAGKGLLVRFGVVD